jgi:hypothetical protein
MAASAGSRVIPSHNRQTYSNMLAPSVAASETSPCLAEARCWGKKGRAGFPAKHRTILTRPFTADVVGVNIRNVRWRGCECPLRT